MLALVVMLQLAQVSSPIGDGVCVTFTTALDSTARELVGESVEGIGGYCSLTGCRLTGTLTMGVGATGTGTGGSTLKTSGFNYATNGWFIGDPAGSLNGMRLEAGLLNFYVGGGIRCQVDGSSRWNCPTTGITSGADLLATTFVQATTYVRSVGVATGSLPTCNAGAAGSCEYDTTVSRWACCDTRTASGYTWRYLITSDTGTSIKTRVSFQSNLATIPSTEGANYNGVWQMDVGAASDQSVTCQSITCQIGAGGAGVLGGATTGVVMQLWDGSTGAEVGTATLGTGFCNAAAGTVTTATCSGTLGGTNRWFTVRMKNTTDCGTNPGNLFCTVNLQNTLASANQAP